MACLYLLGWAVGKSLFGLVTALILILWLWGYFFVLSIKNDLATCVDMWVSLIATALLTFSLFYGRVAKRMPERFNKSASFWIGILLETLLANTLTCATHILGATTGKMGKFSVGGGVSLTIGCAAFVSPIVGWYGILGVVLNRQDAYIKEYHLAVGLHSDREDTEDPANITRNHSSTALQSIRELVRALIERSGDLRMTGLSTPELENLAALIQGEEADGIRFFTRGGGSETERNRFQAFHQGYKYCLDDGNASDNSVVAWIKNWRQSEVKGNPLAAIRNLANDTGEPTCYPALKKLIIRLSVRNDTDRLKTRLWWLCGAIAAACDASIVEASNNSLTESSHAYALVLSALNVDRNSLAAILAMAIDKNMTALDMKALMERGCEEVLRRVSDNVKFCKDRGLIIISADIHSTPVVTYSAAGAWQAEKSREAVVLGAHAFNTLWNASIESPTNDLTLDEKNEVRKNSVEWSKKVSNLMVSRDSRGGGGVATYLRRVCAERLCV